MNPMFACMLVLASASGTTFDGTVEADGPRMVFVATDGTRVPLVDNAVSRKVFADPALLGRAVQFVGKKTDGRLDASAFFTMKDGQRQTVYYWCYNCQLRYEEPGTCMCCGFETTLIEEPASKK